MSLWTMVRPRSAFADCENNGVFSVIVIVSGWFDLDFQFCASYFLPSGCQLHSPSGSYTCRFPRNRLSYCGITDADVKFSRKIEIQEHRNTKGSVKKLWHPHTAGTTLLRETSYLMYDTFLHENTTDLNNAKRRGKPFFLIYAQNTLTYI